MDDLDVFLPKSWSVENEARECWQHFSQTEKESIKKRLDEMFQDGLPFELAHDRQHYVYIFTCFAQIEVLATQLAIRWEKQNKSYHFAQQLRAQIMDEMFHCLVFIKILNLLCIPYAFPPDITNEMSTFCDFLRDEDLNIAVLVLAFVGEIWIEALFQSLYEQNVAPKVFGTIMTDESRHANEAEAYHITVADKVQLIRKIRIFENFISKMSIPQSPSSLPKMHGAMQQLLGAAGLMSFNKILVEKYVSQLTRMNIRVNHAWLKKINFFTKLTQMSHEYFDYHPIELSLHRQVFFEKFNVSKIPIIRGEFYIDVSALGYFEKESRFKLSLLMLQALSKVMSEQNYFRHFYNEKKLYSSKKAIINFVVALPGCGDQIGLILLKDCHKLTLGELAYKLRKNIRLMVFCYQKREQLEREHPELKFSSLSHQTNYLDAVYASPSKLFTNYLGINVTNVGHFGWTQGKNIDPDEVIPGTMVLLAVEKRQVWNKKTKNFTETDLLPISFSTDHRICDANKPVPQLLNDAFQVVLQRFSNSGTKLIIPISKTSLAQFSETIDKLISLDLTIAHRFLSILQECWPDGLDIRTLLEETDSPEEQVAQACVA